MTFIILILFLNYISKNGYLFLLTEFIYIFEKKINKLSRSFFAK